MIGFKRFIKFKFLRMLKDVKSFLPWRYLVNKDKSQEG